jgi:hypothetical protein
MTNPFGYLTVLISIVLGLGLTHLLAGLARSVSRRAETKFYWPTLVWVAVLLILIVQVWWADFALSKQTQWTLAGFSSTLLLPAALYFMSFLILPDSSDMREAYFQNRKWFLSLLIAVPVFGSLQQFLAEGHVHQDLDTAAKGVGLVLSAAALYFGSERAQKAFALIGIVFVIVYVGALFHSPLQS